MRFIFLAMTSMALMTAPAFSDGLRVKMYEALPTGQGKILGTISIHKISGGLQFTPKLKGLTAGQHGFHVHDYGSCAPALQDGKLVPAQSAGGHYDPDKTKHHMGPEGTGHLGDLPALKAGKQGTATESVIATRLKSLDEIRGRTLMIHIGGDNYSDEPKTLGGGGARFACGVIE